MSFKYQFQFQECDFLTFSLLPKCIVNHLEMYADVKRRCLEWYFELLTSAVHAVSFDIFTCVFFCNLSAEHVPGAATESPAMECCACGTAKYRLTFYGNWSEKVHPKDYPSEFKPHKHCCNDSYTEDGMVFKSGRSQLENLT